MWAHITGNYCQVSEKILKGEFLLIYLQNILYGTEIRYCNPAITENTLLHATYHQLIQHEHVQPQK